MDGVAIQFRLQRTVDELVLLDKIFAFKGRGYNQGLVMVTAAGQILHFNMGIGQFRTDSLFNQFGSHHGAWQGKLLTTIENKLEPMGLGYRRRFF